MCKITQQAALAFVNSQPFASGNTTVTVCPMGYVSLILHGHTIARREMCGGEIEVSLAGWPTVTTRERINSLLDIKGSKYRIQQKRGKQYIVDVRGDEKAAPFPENDFVRIIA